MLQETNLQDTFQCIYSRLKSYGYTPSMCINTLSLILSTSVQLSAHCASCLKFNNTVALQSHAYYDHTNAKLIKTTRLLWHTWFTHTITSVSNSITACYSTIHIAHVTNVTALMILVPKWKKWNDGALGHLKKKILWRLNRIEKSLG